MNRDNIIDMIKNREGYVLKLAFLKKQIKLFENSIEQDVYAIAYPTFSTQPKVQKPLGDPVPNLVSTIEKARKNQEDKLFELRYELLSIQQKMDILDNAVDTLPDEQKTVIKERFYEGTTIKRLALEMLVSYSCVYTLTTRAIDNICDLLS